jgi:hypothetical protein
VVCLRIVVCGMRYVSRGMRWYGVYVGKFFCVCGLLFVIWGVWYVVCGLWYEVWCVWFEDCGVRCVVEDMRYVACGMRSGVWYFVCGLWYLGSRVAHVRYWRFRGLGFLVWCGNCPPYLVPKEVCAARGLWYVVWCMSYVVSGFSLVRNVPKGCMLTCCMFYTLIVG